MNMERKRAMNGNWFVNTIALALSCIAASAAYAGKQVATSGSASTVGTISNQKLAEVMPGMSTKAQVQALLGTPWRIVQFNDCGEAMDHQSDETWDYRGKDSNGTYRVHIEFDGHDVAHLVAKIPDSVAGDQGTAAKIAPAGSQTAMKM
jgi:outer membrane protein assembly factor BamE (lipoprotein component of BamABCDE complex)